MGANIFTALYITHVLSAWIPHEFNIVASARYEYSHHYELTTPGHAPRTTSKQLVLPGVDAASCLYSLSYYSWPRWEPVLVRRVVLMVPYSGIRTGIVLMGQPFYPALDFYKVMSSYKTEQKPSSRTRKILHKS